MTIMQAAGDLAAAVCVCVCVFFVFFFFFFTKRTRRRVALRNDRQLRGMVASSIDLLLLRIWRDSELHLQNVTSSLCNNVFNFLVISRETIDPSVI